MSRDYLETHFHTVKALYRQRTGWMQTERIDTKTMLDLEYRIRVHLHVLAGAIDEQADAPTQYPDTFVYLASRFSSRDEKVQQQAAELACEWLMDEGPRNFGARDALLLFPSTYTYAVMREQYAKNSAVRPILIYILTQHGARLPKGLINQAELQIHDPNLQAQVLYYAANDPNNSLDIFQAYYQPVIERLDMSQLEHGSLVAALWGGMLRHDPQAITALQRAIEQESNDFQRLDYLRLAALTGREEYFPLLNQLLEHVPEIGFHFLALHGRVASIDSILEGLSHPRTSAYAEEAWWWVSGQILPKKPRLSLVGEDIKDAEEDVGYVANVQPAERWWSRLDKNINQRWFLGQPLSFNSVHQAAMQYTGLISNDLFDLLALTAGQPIKVGNHTWHDVRLRRLSKITEVTNPKTQISTQEQRRA